MKTLLCFSVTILALVPTHGQVFDAGAPSGGGGQNTTINNSQPKPANNQFLGNDTPFLDPGSETATWNGKAWNVTNNRLFRGRFESAIGRTSRVVSVTESTSGKTGNCRQKGRSPCFPAGLSWWWP